MHSIFSPRRVSQSLSLALAAALAGVAVAADSPSAPLGPPSPFVNHISTGTPTAPATQPGGALPSIVGSSNPTSLGATLAPLPLGKPFERMAAGISIRPPAGWTGVMQADRDEIAIFVDDLKKQDRTLSLTRRTFPQSQHLFAIKDDKGAVVKGIMENTLDALLQELPGAKVLRAGDPTNIGKADVGMIVMRYTKNGERRLAQHAVIQGNDQLFYLIAYNTPARKDVAEDNNAEEKTIDPGEQQAVDTFRAILDSVKLLDLAPVRDDQTARLYRTRTLLYNLTEKKLSEVLIPERYLRIIKEGKDIGYSYVGEGLGRAKKPKRSAPGEQKLEMHAEFDGTPGGYSIGIRTRVMTLKDGKVHPFPREDSEAWLYTTFDRRNEDWSKISVFDEDGQPKTEKNPWRKVSEVGSSKKEIHRVIAIPNDPNRDIHKGSNDDPKQPWVDLKENYHLDVQFKATRGELPPLTQQLPPFYLPQAMAEILPRLVPSREPKTYLIAAYVSEVRKVAMRYIDVRAEEALPAELARLTGVVQAIPVDDRIGYEGVITTHYVTAKGEYLGSYTKNTQMIVVPTDERTLNQIWHATPESPLFALPEGPAQPAPAAVNSTSPGVTPPSTPLPPRLNGKR